MPSLRFEEIVDTLRPADLGGILEKDGVVETINCLSKDGTVEVESRLGGGVFVIAESDGEAYKNTIRHKGFEHGTDPKRVLLYRPYHFVGIETPMTILKACLEGTATAAPLPTPSADVVTIAKRDIKRGEVLKGIGSDSVRGEMVTRTESLRTNALPLVLAQNITALRDIRAGEQIDYGSVTKMNDFLWNLRAEQDAF